MTNSTNDRLNRIEAILERTAEQQEHLQASHQAWQEEFQVKLDDTRAIAESASQAAESAAQTAESASQAAESAAQTAESASQAAESAAQTAESVSQAAESAARSAQANSDTCSELRQANADLRETLRVTIEDTYENLLRPMVERIDATTEQVNRLVDESQANYEEHKEWSQRFENLLNDARADRQRAEEQQQAWNQRFDEHALANEAEHRAFRQTIQTLLAEIARLWERLSA